MKTRRELDSQTSACVAGYSGVGVDGRVRNVAGLLIARGEYRRKEIATWLALGASRGKVVRQLLAEPALLAAAATVAALFLGNFVLNQLPNFLPQTSFPIAIDAHLNSRALLFALATALASLFLFGLVPALQDTERVLSNARTALARALIPCVIL